MSTSAQQATIEHIHASGKQFLLAATGGGSGAISALLKVPGASASVVGAIVPYAHSALTQWLGGTVDQACSERTARAMAMRAFDVAREFTTADVGTIRGVGVTASLVSNRPKRGAHRIHVAWQSDDATVAISCELKKGARTRVQEERIATCLVLGAVAEACGVDAPSLSDSTVRASVERREQRASAAWSELMLGQRQFVSVPVGMAPDQPPAVLFPGAFNPLHLAHRRMAEVAKARLGSPVTYELSIVNVDKPSLDFIEIADRLGPLQPNRVLLTRAATFIEKARLAPGCVFVVGVDTLARIAESRYYRGDVDERDAAIAAITRAGCRFLVFGRQQAAGFLTLAELEIPAALRGLCEEVPESQFHIDVSSTQLRQHC